MGLLHADWVYLLEALRVKFVASYHISPCFSLSSALLYYMELTGHIKKFINKLILERESAIRPLGEPPVCHGPALKHDNNRERQTEGK